MRQPAIVTQPRWWLRLLECLVLLPSGISILLGAWRIFPKPPQLCGQERSLVLRLLWWLAVLSLGPTKPGSWIWPEMNQLRFWPNRLVVWPENTRLMLKPKMTPACRQPERVG